MLDKEEDKSTGVRRAVESKMRAPLLLLGGIVVLSLAVARALSCVCSPLECDVLTKEDCPGGLTWDPCRYTPTFTRCRSETATPRVKRFDKGSIGTTGSLFLGVCDCACSSPSPRSADSVSFVAEILERFGVI